MSRLLSRGRLTPKIRHFIYYALIATLIVIAIVAVQPQALAKPQDDSTCTVPESIYSIAFSPDGQFLAVGTNEGIIQIWNVETGKLRFSLQDQNSDDIVYRLSYSPDGKLLVVGFNKYANVWDLRTGKHIYTFPAQDFTSGGVSLYFTSDSKQIFVSDTFGGILWDAQTGKQLRRFSSTANDIDNQMSPNGQYILTNSENGVSIWDAQTGVVLNKLLDSRFTVGSLSPDGTIAFIKLNKETGIVWDILAQKQLRTIPLKVGHLWWYWMPNGKYILIFYDHPIEIAEIWNLQTGKEILTLPQEGINGFDAVFSSDNDKLLLIASHLTPKPYEIWSIKQRKIVGRISVHNIQNAKFSPDGTKLIFTEIIDGVGMSIQLWDTLKFTKILEFC